MRAVQVSTWTLILSLLVTHVCTKAVDTDDPGWSLDGINYSNIPMEFKLAAYMLEIQSTMLECGHRTRDMPAVCPTQECMDMLKKYEEWREQNGYGIASGRWG